jgi:hypothetical protein
MARMESLIVLCLREARKRTPFRVHSLVLFWYQSHYSDQYSDGAVGTIIINGPAASNNDYDLGTLTISDWYCQTAFEVQATLVSPDRQETMSSSTAQMSMQMELALITETQSSKARSAAYDRPISQQTIGTGFASTTITLLSSQRISSQSNHI